MTSLISMLLGSVGLELFPSACTTLIHGIIAVAYVRKIRQGAIFVLFFALMSINTMWTLGHTLYWATRNDVWELVVGIILPLSPTTMYLFASTYPQNTLDKRRLLVYIFPLLIWIPSALIGTASVVGTQFALFQMPYMLLMDVLSGMAWLRTSTLSGDERVKKAA